MSEGDVAVVDGHDAQGTATDGSGLWASIRQRPPVMAVVLALSFAPLLTIFAVYYLWPRPHYQFFPLAIAGVGYLIWLRWPRGRTEPPIQGGWLEAVLLVSGVGILAAAAAVWYAPLAGAGALLTTLGLLMHYAGRQSLPAMLPPWLVLWVIIPPPPPLDTTLLLRLQQLAARTSSLLLDSVGVKHFMEGTVLEFPDKRLLVEEACSGVQSLYALLACTALFVVWARRPWYHGIPLLLSAIFWALAANVGRVIAVAIGHAFFEADLATGWQHDALGFVTFGSALLMLASTDQLLSFVFNTYYGPATDFESASAARAQQRRMLRDQQRQASDSREGKERPVAKALCSLAVVVGGLLGVFQWTVVLSTVFLAREQTAQQESQVSRTGFANAMTEDSMPEQVGGWRRVDFVSEEREVDSYLGERSKGWTYEMSGRQMVVSLDYPFTGWHDLSVCYRNVGWSVVERSENKASPTEEAEEAPYYETLELRKPTGEHGLVVYSILDRQGRPVDSRSAINRLAPMLKRHPVRVLFGSKALEPFDATTFQAQVFVASEHSLPDEEQEALREVFLQIRELFRQTILANAPRAN